MNNKTRIHVLRLAIPFFVELVLKTMVGSVNTFMLSHISDHAAASVAVSNQILNIILAFSTMLASGTMILANQEIGAGNTKEVREVTTLGAVFSTSVGIILGMISLIFAEPFVRMLGLEEALIADAVWYLKIVGGTCVVQFISAFCSAQLRCIGKAYLAMLSTIGINLINIGGSLWVIMFWTGGRGVIGISIVRAISETVGLLFLLVPFYKYFNYFLAIRYFISWKYVGAILKTSVSFGVESLSYMLAKLITVSFITALPVEILSAKTYAQTISSYNYLLGTAFAQASQIMVGQLIGAGKDREAEWLIQKTAVIALCSNLFFSLLFLAFYKHILGIFTSSAVVIHAAHQVMKLDVLIAVGRSLGHVYGNALKATGYVLKPMIIAIIGIWGFSVGSGYLFSVTCSLGIVGIWIGEIMDEWIRAVLLAGLWLRKKWVPKRRMVQERR